MEQLQFCCCLALSLSPANPRASSRRTGCPDWCLVHGKAVPQVRHSHNGVGLATGGDGMGRDWAGCRGSEHAEEAGPAVLAKPQPASSRHADDMLNSNGMFTVSIFSNLSGYCFEFLPSPRPAPGPHQARTRPAPRLCTRPSRSKLSPPRPQPASAGSHIVRIPALKKKKTGRATRSLCQTQCSLVVSPYLPFSGPLPPPVA